jgi:hypothetical protein
VIAVGKLPKVAITAVMRKLVVIATVHGRSTHLNML